ncbi:tyrosinase family protein [Arthrobacter sp. A5]|uniref:tyrosinase family protein n=1 Tax=Arthrobacter sp. A5 TaxID=576926 RepID=UPI003DA8BE3C
MTLFVVDDPAGPYLRTGPDDSEANNLNRLPDCLSGHTSDGSPLPPAVRRNVASISVAERDRLRDAILELNRRLYPDGVTEWFKQDQIHQATHVHGSAAFLPWHRELINRFEALLRRVDSGVALHYWDWQTDPRKVPDGRGGEVDLFTEEFMGAAQDRMGPPFDGFDNDGVRRGSRYEPPGSYHPELPPTLVTRFVADGAPNQGPEPWPITSDNQIISSGDDKPRAQQFDAMQTELQRQHGLVHFYIGGNLAGTTGPGRVASVPSDPAHFAFQDPFVFLLHSNVDRLWASWQLRRVGDSRAYSWRLLPDETYGEKGSDHSITENMLPWSGGKGTQIRPWMPPDNQQKVKTSSDRSIVAPPLYDRYIDEDICFSWQAMQLARTLPDGDVISVGIEYGAVNPLNIEFVLEAAPQVRWWKMIRVSDGEDPVGIFDIFTEGARTSDRVTLWASQVRSGQQLEFRKAKFGGAKRWVYRLGDLDRLPAGARVTFRWLKD